MTKPLKRRPEELYHFCEGERVTGINPEMSGDCSELEGDCSGLRGDLDEIPMEERESKPYLKDWIEGENQ